MALAALTLIAAGLRIPRLTETPPGLNQDEACNAWNAWCLLNTGRDQTGTPWPLFYLHAFGENRSVLHVYVVLPFQALGGLNIWTTRLPSAVLGVLTIPLLYFVAVRLFDRTTALIAAALLTLAPWHIQLTRTGHEAGIVPLLVILPLAALLWAGFPLGDAPPRPKVVRALLAGLLAGVCCYGYPAVLLVIPPLLVASVLCSWRTWRGLLLGRRDVPPPSAPVSGPQLLPTRSSITACAALLIGFAGTFGPLVYQYAVRHEIVAKRAAGNWLWADSDGTAARVGKVLQRYAAHFGPDFLFIAGDHHETQFTPGFGAFQWYVLPPLLLGLLCALRWLRRSASARLTLCWLLVAPLGDSFHHGFYYQTPDGHEHASMHALRAAPLIAPPLLLAALGARTAHGWLRHRRRAAALAVYALAGLAVIALDTRFLRYYFREYHRLPLVYESYQVDLVEACVWLRPRLRDLDAIVVNAQDMNVPYVIALVVFGCSPQDWFSAPREMVVTDGWETYTRVGKLYFLHNPGDESMIDELRRNGRADRVAFVVRPGQLPGSRPVHVIHAPNGTPFFEIHERTL